MGLVGRTYEEKLTKLGLNTLKDRRIQINLIQTFKIFQWIDRVDPATWFNTAGDNVTRLTRITACAYNEGNLLSNRSNTDQRKNFFTNRVIPISRKNREKRKFWPTVLTSKLEGKFFFMYSRGHRENILKKMGYLCLTRPEMKNWSRRRSFFKGSKSPERGIDNLTLYPAPRQLHESTFKNRTGC